VSPLNHLSVIDAAKRLAQRELSAEAYVRSFIERIDARDAEVRAWVHVGRDLAIARAKALDAGPHTGPLHGVPIGIKDVFETYDMPTQGGSEVYKGFHGQIDAACVALMRRAGGVILGKTVTTELATTPPNGTRNPHNLEYTPGGSSSGSAAAIADRMVPLAIGTQTLGSTIRPASFCGVYSYKSTYNLIPKKGMWNSSDSNDTVGLFANSVRDLAWFAAGTMNFPGLIVPDAVPVPRIGLCRTEQWELATPEMKAALENAGRALAAAGAKVFDVSLPSQFKGLLEAQSLVSSFETGRSFADEVDRAGGKLRKQLLDRCLASYDLDPEAYLRAQSLARECRQMVPEALEGCDVLLSPAALGEAPKGLDWTGDPRMNQIWTFLHVPCVAVPAGKGPHGLPLGLQVIGRLEDDARTLAAADWIAARISK
jgi:Asp-tRNA(Asn)/Glu-tRNA(Gln) amidotransferase A subunit family amidase